MARLSPSRSIVCRASTSREAGNASDTITPTAAPITVSSRRCPPKLTRSGVTVDNTTSTLIGTWRADAAGSRSTSSDTASDPATSSPTVSPFRPSTSPIASATSTPNTTAMLRSIAERNDERTETCTTTSAVSGARTGSGMFVTTLANHHDTPAASPDFATVAISVEVGRVHDTAFAMRCHRSRARCTGWV